MPKFYNANAIRFREYGEPVKLRVKTFELGPLVSKINSNDLNLQPDFQRGEVWTDSKKRRLVDTILRKWYVPAVHLIELKDKSLEVLDGQQRLSAMRDFMNGEFKIDGGIEPSRPDIQKLDALSFAQLPYRQKNAFIKFKIRAVILHEYAPEEPGELFFRLNQLSGLTPAEQRNAFYGAARFQTKEIVESYSETLFRPDVLGFSNARMGYDDIVARLCFALSVGTHHIKVTSKAIEEKFRSKEGFAKAAVKRARAALDLFSRASSHFGPDVRFNKATLVSWLCFVAEVEKEAPGVATPDLVGRFVRQFELHRSGVKSGETGEPLLLVFNDRASSRVSDITSVLARDFVLWHFWVKFCRENAVQLLLGEQHLNALKGIAPTIKPPPQEDDFDVEATLMNSFTKHKWGASL